MTRSVIACAIGAEESCVLRMKRSAGEGRIVSDWKTFPFGLRQLCLPGGRRGRQKLSAYAASWKGEGMALAVWHDSYRPLPAFFEEGASAESRDRDCRTEAAAFLADPSSSRHDIIAYSESHGNGLHEKHLILFYPGECHAAAGQMFGQHHPMLFQGSALVPLLSGRNAATVPRTILALADSHIMLAVAGREGIEHFAYREIHSPAEAEYFLVKEMQEAPIPIGVPVEVTGLRARRQLLQLLRKETGLEAVPLSLPSSLSVSGVGRKSAMPSSLVSAIATADMVLE